MRDRRRKMMKANGDNDISGDHEHGDHHDTAAAAADGNNSHGKEGSHKRGADQISNDDASMNKKAKTSNEPTTIITPADLTPKEAKKFRKDARRKARAQGQSEDQIKFIIEGQTPEEPTTEKEETDASKKSKPKKSFPRINDLLSQHATQQKIDDKLSKQKSINDSLPSLEKEKYVAIDCEMVGIGTDGKKSALARASVTNWDGEVLLDTFVRVSERVTDFRTFVSGVRPKNIHVKNMDAMDHEECRLAVGKLLLNKILVGHALKNDLSCLMLSHPRVDIRDTARYKPFMRPSGRGGGKMRPRKLRDLVYEQLGKRIQVEGEAHCSIDDAQATMELFKVVKGRWEKELDAKKSGVSRGKK